MRVVSRKPAEAAPLHMGKLAKLPLFFDLSGKRCLVAGGSAAAAWKAELLAAAGAHVEVYALAPGNEMQTLVARGPADGSISLHIREWDSDIFYGTCIAIADCADPVDAERFVRCAHAAGALANVIDNPEFRDFQFGAIVNRSPVVVGISTDGAAPILGQAIRRRIETVMPLSLSAWAGLARTIRVAVMTRLERGIQRHVFWERFADMAFTRPASAAGIEAADMIVSDVVENISSQRGHVTLVGAGPGDAELLTLKAVRALQAADVILYDDLVSPAILDLARREAKRMTVGKRAFKPSCGQSDINAIMLKLAQQGKRIVRLKSGDPMIFGRAGEEIALLEKHGIAVTVVPGVTAALAMAAQTRVSLTHRDHAQSVSFVTGHAKTGELPDNINWPALARADTTTVFYMGARNAADISEKLISHGAAFDMPVIAAASVSQPEQSSWKGCLKDLEQGIASLPASGPILISVGHAMADYNPVSERTSTTQVRQSINRISA